MFIESSSRSFDGIDGKKTKQKTNAFQPVCVFERAHLLFFPQPFVKTCNITTAKLQTQNRKMLECFAIDFYVFLQINRKTCINVVCIFNKSRLPVYDQKNVSNRTRRMQHA